MGQKVLVIGSGAREHTIAYTLLKAPSIDEVTVAPGNPGMLKDGIHTTQLSQSNHAALIEFVKNNGYDWVFVGPEVPLIEGIVDDFAAAGIKAFGPSKAAAQIEGSKDFAKQLMDRHNIPTAKYKTFGDLDMAQAYVHEHGAPIVIKADGLAAGKGVTVAMDEHTAQRALEDIFIDHRFGSAGAKVVIEDFLDGQEFSLMSFVNGTDFWPMPISRITSAPTMATKARTPVAWVPTARCRRFRSPWSTRPSRKSCAPPSKAWPRKARRSPASCTPA